MTALLPMDIHSHSENSPDADYLVLKMCEAAMEKRIALFAITDHYDIYLHINDYSALDATLDKAIREISAARDLYRGKLRILAGIELGQPLENQAKAEEVLKSHPFDFVLGSLHNPPGSPDFYLYDPADESYELEKELENYFIRLLATVRWGGFDSAAHLSLPFRYILRHHPDYLFGKWDDYLESIVKALAEQGLALEVNTSGVLNRPSYTMPEGRWVKRFKELGGEKLTLGADAHSPQRVGAGILEGMAIAAEAGFAYLCYFLKRQPHYIKLEEYR